MEKSNSAARNAAALGLKIGLTIILPFYGITVAAVADEIASGAVSSGLGIGIFFYWIVLTIPGLILIWSSRYTVLRRIVAAIGSSVTGIFIIECLAPLLGTSTASMPIEFGLPLTIMVYLGALAAIWQAVMIIVGHSPRRPLGRI